MAPCLFPLADFAALVVDEAAVLELKSQRKEL
jgi:hypothetical protein